MHETAKDLYDSGHINQMTMHHFDSISVKNLREQFGLSQAVFAEYLNVSKKLIQKWEHDTSNPKGAAAKLLSLAQRNGLQAIT